MGARLEAQVMVSSDAKEGEWFHLYLDRGYDNKTIREIVAAWGCESIAKCLAIVWLSTVTIWIRLIHFSEILHRGRIFINAVINTG